MSILNLAKAIALLLVALSAVAFPTTMAEAALLLAIVFQAIVYMAPYLGPH